jgi:anti-sigma factor RsiW
MNKLASIHPDHLLDLARRGALPPDERQRLGAHLAACRPCAWEQAATDDFEREQGFLEAGGAFDAAHLDRLVEGALARAGLVTAAAVTLGDTPKPPAKPRAAQPRSSRWGLAAAAVIAAAIGAAMTLPTRGPLDTARVDPERAFSDANLDAGAVSAGVGDDS